MNPKAGEVFSGVRALLNDNLGAVYNNAVILPYFQIALEELRQDCEDYSIPITNKTSAAITISQGITDIGGPNGPALPDDLIEPLECWEIVAGTNSDYMLMVRKDFLPKTSTLTAYLEVYTWAEQYIHFLGANGDIQVKIDYIASNFGAVKNENSIIKVSNAVNYLKYRSAAMCAMFIMQDEDRAQVLNDLYTNAKDIFLNIKVKSQQNIMTRRRPFLSSYKNRGGMYGGR